MYFCSGAWTDIHTCANLVSVVKTYRYEQELRFSFPKPFEEGRYKCIDCVATQCELLWEEVC